MDKHNSNLFLVDLFLLAIHYDHLSYTIVKPIAKNIAQNTRLKYCLANGWIADTVHDNL